MCVGASAWCTVTELTVSVLPTAIKDVVVLAGAGISVAAGIPDFRCALHALACARLARCQQWFAMHVTHRSPGTGLYDNLQKYDLPEPTAVFDIGFFRTNPKPFFHLSRELLPGGLVPTRVMCSSVCAVAVVQLLCDCCCACSCVGRWRAS